MHLCHRLALLCTFADAYDVFSISGAGVVEFSSEAAAKEAIKKMSNFKFKGRVIRINQGNYSAKLSKSKIITQSLNDKV